MLTVTIRRSSRSRRRIKKPRSSSASITATTLLLLMSSFSPFVFLGSGPRRYESSKAADLEPFSPYYRFELGRLYLALGDGKKAEASVRRAVEIEPNFLPGRRFLAQLYLDSNRIEGATREYREIIERRERYAEWPKGPVEEQLLETDVTSLRAVFESVRSQT